MHASVDVFMYVCVWMWSIRRSKCGSMCSVDAGVCVLGCRFVRECGSRLVCV